LAWRDAGSGNGGPRCTTPVRARDGYFHPSTEEELIALVAQAAARRVPLRVRGAAHSIPAAIYSDHRLAGHIGAFDVVLDRFARVVFDDERLQVTVESGCRLGEDAREPSGNATWARSLLAQLDARGWALPDLGGVTQQTVAGFFSTGSSGGSTRHAIEDALVRLRFIDGRARVHEIGRDDERFHALSCSMGLLGVVSRITLQCIERFDIVGREDVTSERGCAYGLFDRGESGLAAFLQRTEYSRLMWWPQPGVRRVATWQARRMRSEDYDEHTGPRGRLKRAPYQAIVKGLSPAVTRPLSEAVQAAGGAFFDALELAGATRRTIAQRAPALASPLGLGASVLKRAIVPPVLRRFVEVDHGEPQLFRDSWCHGLPLDNQMSETSLPTTFTEIWIPLDQTANAMRELRALFRAGGLDTTGSYIFELYAARATKGWLHPGYQRDSFRVDVFWFERNRQDPQRFFQQFWDALAGFDYRLHWGKHLPGKASRGSDYLAARYPRWRDFLALRRELDPHNIFLTAHFRRALAIDDAPASVPAPFVRAPLIEIDGGKHVGVA
jgi:FAD/FMN-containing dehydrogenase